MENQTKNHVCPVERAGGLDHSLRRLIQNPKKILRPYIKENMNMIDLGSGPGFFTIEASKMMNGTGKVIAVDLQKGMLDRLQSKIHNNADYKNIELHHCKANRIGINEKADFILAFYVIHEISDQESLFNELRTILKPHGKILIVEPKFHVKKQGFKEIILEAQDSGFKPHKCKQPLFSRAVMLTI